MKKFELNQKEVEVIKESLEVKAKVQELTLDKDVSKLSNEVKEQRIQKLQDVKDLIKRFK